MTKPATPSGTCCSPSSDRGVTAPTWLPDPPPHGATVTHDTALIPGGVSGVGTNHPLIPEDGEGPFRRTKLRSLRMGTDAVTNRAFAAFINDTGHMTDAERYGWSFVFWSDVPGGAGATQGVAGQDWWRQVHGATWRDIHGPGTAPDTWHPDHPVVHVSWNDATAYARWAGGRLPTEAEWEHAARGGQGDVRYPWGDQDPDDSAFLPCNIWQGVFPGHNTARDGWAATAPVHAYAPNAYGLYNMVGNVWEWTAEPFRIRSIKRGARARMDQMRGFKVLKGGSFLCHASYCHRYRIAARIGNSPDTTTAHQGFRVVWDI